MKPTDILYYTGTFSIGVASLMLLALSLVAGKGDADMLRGCALIGMLMYGGIWLAKHADKNIGETKE